MLRTGRFGAVIGRALPLDEPLLAPFTGRPCVGFRVVRSRLQDAYRRGSRIHWELEADEEWCPDFLVEDKTGRALVRPQGYLRLDLPGRVPSSNDSATIDGFIRRYGYEKSKFFDGFHSTLRYVETIIEVGRTIRVGGLVGSTSIAAPSMAGGSYRAPPERVLPVLSPEDDERLYIGD